MILNVLHQLDEANIEYVSWKNNHLIEESLSGKRDVDLYIPYHHKRNFERVLENDKWIKMDNKFIRFPWVVHFYRLSPNGEFYHLHVYYKIITGESALKEYMLPLGEYFIKNREKNERDIWVLNSEAQSFIFFLRHMLKGVSYQSRRSYKKEIDSYNDEFKLIEHGLNHTYKEVPFDITSYIQSSGLTGSKIKLPNLNSARKFRREFYFYRRSLVPIIIHRINSLYYRALNKLFYKSKKVFLEEGLIFSITGIDGSGKTTILNNIEKDMQRFFTVKKIHMGKPFPKVLEKSLSIFKNIRKKELESNKNEKKLQKSYVMKSFLLLFLAFMRLCQAKKCMNYSKRGYLVLTDRWPTSTHGYMDGPKIFDTNESSNLVRFLAQLEKKIYKLMPETDVCFIFDVPLDVALKRNSEREVEEDEQELIKRFDKNIKLEPICARKIFVKNEDELNIQLIRIREMFWEEVIKTQS